MGAHPPGLVQEGKRPAIHGQGRAARVSSGMPPHKGTLSPACAANSRVLAGGVRQSLLSPCRLAR